MRSSLTFILLASLGACSSPTVIASRHGADSDGDIERDGGFEVSDACVPPALSGDASLNLERAIGLEIGDRFEGFRFEDCAGTSIGFEALLSDADLLLVNVAAGWCAPCVEETQTMEIELYRAYCGRGLRVAQILFEDDLTRPVTSHFCSQWSQRFGLTFPVLRDPLFRSESFFEDGDVQTPLNLLIDREGVIVYRSSGEADDTLADVIDEVLP